MIVKSARAVAVAAAVGSLLQGWDSSAMAGALLYIKPEFKMESNPSLESLTLGASLIGAVMSTLVAGPTSDWLGRRAVLSIAATLFSIGGCVTLWSATVYVLIVGRMFTGAAIGFTVTTVPILVSECAPTAIRGQLATIPQLICSTGQFLAYVLVFAFSQLIVNPAQAWRLMLGFQMLPAVIYLALCAFYLPETPRWLVSKGRMITAKNVLQQLYLKDDVSAELSLLVEGLGVGVETSLEEYILIKPTATPTAAEAPQAVPGKLVSHADREEGIVLYAADSVEQTQSWLAKPLSHIQDYDQQQQRTGSLLSSRSGSLSGSTMRLLDPTVTLLGSIQSNLESLMAGENEFAAGEQGEAYTWEELEGQPQRSPHPRNDKVEEDSLAVPLLVDRPPKLGASASMDMRTSTGFGRVWSSPRSGRAMRKSVSNVSAASSTRSARHPSSSSLTELFGNRGKLSEGAWQLAWQWEEGTATTGNIATSGTAHVAAVPTTQRVASFKRVYLLPENPDQTDRPLYLGRDEEGVAAAAFVSQPALLATAEVLGEEPSGPVVVHPSATAAPGPLWSVLTEIGVRRAIVVGMGLQILQQLSGISAIVYYTPQILADSRIDVIFSSFGLDSNSSSLLASAFVCLLMLPCILVAMRLMDVAGRRQLLLGTLPILVISLLMLVASKLLLTAGGTVGGLVSVVALAMFTCCFVTGLGPVPGIVSSEIFPTRVRGLCIGICSMGMWASNAVVTNSFPFVLRTVGITGAFTIFAGATVLGWVFIFLKVPETKGVPLEVISEIFAYRPSADSKKLK